MSEPNHDLIHRWFEEVWNQDNEDAIDELMDPEGRAFDFPEPGGSVDREGFKAAFRQFRSAFSEVNVQVEDILNDKNMVAARWTATMKHSGPGLGFPPTGETVTVRGIAISEVRDGKILHGWNALDLATPVSELRARSEKQA